MLPNSTLRLLVTKQSINYQTPWAVGVGVNSTATVSVVKHAGDTYLLTNAHAVSEATHLKIKFNQKAIELEVKVAWRDPILDLAILQIHITNPDESMRIDALKKADDLIHKMDALELMPEFQKQQTEVFAYGYPAGGTTLSFTKGNISRVEVGFMSLSKERAITVQTSAPINPGNSGGPITIKSLTQMNKELCIGIVAQGSVDLQNTGYFIPACTVIETIDRYKKYRSIKEQGFIDFVTAPSLVFRHQELKNRMFRKALGLADTSIDEELTGILVTSVPLLSAANGILREGDIIQQIGGYKVLANGEVQVPELESPVNYLYLILRKKYFDTLPVVVQRKNEDTKELETVEFNIRLNKQLGQNFLGRKIAEPLIYHIQPSGQGAFVFVVCTQGLISTYKNQAKPSVPSFFGQLSAEDVHQVVVLQQVIASTDTDGFEDLSIIKGAGCIGHRIAEVNKEPINNMYDLIAALSDTTKHSEVRFANGKVLYIAPSSPEDISQLKRKQVITFFTSPSVKMDPRPVINDIKALGERDDNRYDFLKSTKTGPS